MIDENYFDSHQILLNSQNSFLQKIGAIILLIQKHTKLHIYSKRSSNNQYQVFSTDYLIKLLIDIRIIFDQNFRIKFLQAKTLRF